MIGDATRSAPRNSYAGLNYWTDMIALVSATIAFVTGLMLLARFHMGADISREAAWGMSRLAWVNLHRLSAAVALPSIALHIVLHWRAITTRVRRTMCGLPGKARAADLVLYVGFVAVALEGLVSWLIVPGSPPLNGPVALKHLAPARHLCIDLHNISGLCLLPAAAIHIRRHMKCIANPDWIRAIGGRL